MLITVIRLLLALGAMAFSRRDIHNLGRLANIADTGELACDGPLYSRLLATIDDMLGPSPMYCRTHNVSVCLYIAYKAVGSASLYIKTLYFFLTVLALSAAATIANIKIRYDAKIPQFSIFGTRVIYVFYSNLRRLANIANTHTAPTPISHYFYANYHISLKRHIHVLRVQVRERYMPEGVLAKFHLAAPQVCGTDHGSNPWLLRALRCFALFCLSLCRV